MEWELAQVVLVSGREGVELEEDLCDFGPLVMGVHARHVNGGETEAVLSLNNCSVLLEMGNNTLRNQKTVLCKTGLTYLHEHRLHCHRVISTTHFK